MLMGKWVNAVTVCRSTLGVRRSSALCDVGKLFLFFYIVDPQSGDTSEDPFAETQKRT